jgi:hypothetical protein
MDYVSKGALRLDVRSIGEQFSAICNRSELYNIYECFVALKTYPNSIILSRDFALPSNYVCCS